MRASRYNTWVRADGRHFVHNGVSGALVGLTDDERAVVDRFLSDPEYDVSGYVPLLEALVRARILVADAIDELAVLQQRYHRSRHATNSLRLTIVTSLGCNFACPYCFEAKEPALLLDEVADAIVDRVEAALPDLEQLGVTWFGGEPLLGKRQLLDLSGRLVGMCTRGAVKYSASIITNGWHLDGPTAKQLADHHVRSAQITLDGPPDVHDRRRPRIGGASTFWTIVDNLREAVEHLRIVVRINVDADNVGDVEPLVALLAQEGLAGKVSLSPSRLLGNASNPLAPLATYCGCAMNKAAFASFESSFHELARRYGFSGGRLPGPVSTPCTAVNANDLVIGAHGELWKCWDDVGDTSQAFGTIFDWDPSDDRRLKWLRYDPFDDPQCASCIALPGCMGGCAYLAMSSDDRDEQCSTFRFNRRERVEAAVSALLASGTASPRLTFPDLSHDARSRPERASPPRPVPVTLTRRPASTLPVGE